jgi:hypothetical protein
MGDVFFVAPPGMIGVAVRNNGLIHGSPGIEVNISGFAVNSFFIKGE